MKTASNIIVLNTLLNQHDYIDMTVKYKHSLQTEPSMSQKDPLIHQKYNYLEHSFERQLQRSYEKSINQFSPPSLQRQYLQSSTQKQLQPAYNPKGFGYRSHSKSPQQRSSQFSPYENKEENVRDRVLLQELKVQNRVLQQKIYEDKNIIDQLTIELKLRNEEFANINQLRQKERLIHDAVIKEMKQEINIVLTKNSMLEKRALLYDKEIRELERSRDRSEAKTRSISANAAANLAQSNVLSSQRLLAELSNALENREEKRINKSFSNNTKLPDSCAQMTSNPKAAKFQQQFEDLLSKIYLMARKNHKYEEMINSIIQMHHKITGGQLVQGGLKRSGGELKNIWKWLKQLGHHYNITQKWKKILVQVLGITDSQDLTIDSILQKTVVRIHSKTQ